MNYEYMCYLSLFVAILALTVAAMTIYIYREDRRITETTLQASITQLVGIANDSKQAMITMSEVVRHLGINCPARAFGNCRNAEDRSRTGV